MDLQQQKADFTPPANGIGQGSVTIGQKTGTIQIPILNDNLDEPNETFTITLSNPRHAILSKILTELVTTVTIEDDDVPELEISAVNQITEGAVANVDFTITADIMPRNNLTIHYLPVSAGFLSPEISNKPQTTSQPLVFTAVDSSNPSNTTATATFSLPLVSDTIAEENGTVVVTLQAPSPAESTSPNYRLHATNYLTTIDLVDDDSEIPVLIVAGPTNTTAESAGSVEFTVIAYDDQTKSNSINPGRNITIQYTPEEVNPGNFLRNAGTPNTAIVNFNERDGIWTSTFAVEIDDDSSGEATGNIKVTLNDDPATISTYTVSTGDDKSAEATIWDDDAPELSIVAGPAVTEGDDVKATFKVISNVLPSTNSIPIQYTPTSATYIAGSGTPVTANPGVSFDKNDTTGKYEGTIEVDIVNDNTYEPDGSVSVTLNSESPATNYYVVSPESASVAVSDDDPIPTISVANLTPSLLENSGSVRIPVTLSNLTAETASVRWSTTHGTATANDYIGGQNQTLEFNNSTSETIEITLQNDNTFEGDEDFTITLSNPTNASIPGESGTIVITVTLLESVPKETVRFTNSTATVAENVSGNMVNLEIRIGSPLASAAVTVDYTTSTSTELGMATADSDFTVSTSGTATIRSKNRTGMIQIPIINDNIDEPNETFTVTISNPINAQLSATPADSTITVTITDDDVPEFSISAGGNVRESTSATADFIITSDIIPRPGLEIHYLPVSTNFLSTSVSNTAQNNDQLVFTQANSDAPIVATLSVPLDSDDTKELNGTVQVTLQNDDPVGTDYTVNATNNNATVNIEDDDAEIPVLVISGPAGGVAESVGNATFTVTAYSDQTKTSSIDPGRPITIQFTPEEFANGDFLTNAVAGVAQTTELTFTGTNTFTDTFSVTLHNDNSPEASGKIRVTLNDDPATLKTYIVSTRGDRIADVNIWDDDAPELTITAGSAVTEGADVKASFKIISRVLPTTDLSLQYTPEGANYITGSGTKVTSPILASSFTLNSVTNNYESTLEIDVVNDQLNEPNGNVSVTLNSETTPTTYFVGSPANATVAVSDDDPIPTISVVDLTPSINEANRTISIPVTLSNPTTETVEIDWSTATDTASSSDFEEQLNQTLQISGSTQSTSNLTGNDHNSNYR